MNIEVSYNGVQQNIQVNTTRPNVNVALNNSRPNVNVQVTQARGPAGPPGQGIQGYTAENKDSVTLIKGTPITEDPSGSGFLRADASSTSKYCVGLVIVDTPATIAGKVQNTDVIELVDWTPIIGAVSLSAKTKYYLSTTPGMLTSNPGGGQIIQLIGYAVDQNKLSISINSPIIL